MSRQHSAPILLRLEPQEAVPLQPLGTQAGDEAFSEAQIQTLVQTYPASLPIAEIDSMFVGPVPICTELQTPAGPIDNFMVTPSGLPVLVECKLWRNPEGRREVVGQILDYAKELSRWSSSDLQRAVNRRLKSDGNPLLRMVRDVDPSVNETDFNDALTQNLRRGRFLLLIVGDGIREGVETITEYLQQHAGLHFSLGLIELPIYIMPNGDRLVVPRILAKTATLARQVVAVPDGYRVEEAGETNAADSEIDPDRSSLGYAQQRFWSEFLPYVKLDDPEQPIPKPPRQGFLSFTLPAPAGASWLTVYRDIRRNEVGVMLSYSRNGAGEYAATVIAEDWEIVRRELGGTAVLTANKDGRPRIIDSLVAGPLDEPDVRAKAFVWLSERVNAFVNVMRPRVRSAVADYEKSGA